MKYLKIAMKWNAKLDALKQRADDWCATRIKELVTLLSRFNIQDIAVSTGTWRLRSGEIWFVFDDGTGGIRDSAALDDWLNSQFGDSQPEGTLLRPKDLSAAELGHFEELYALCEWWVITTGGHNISFASEEPTFAWDLFDGDSVEPLCGHVWILHAEDSPLALCVANGRRQPIDPRLSQMSPEELRAAADWVQANSR